MSDYPSRPGAVRGSGTSEAAAASWGDDVLGTCRRRVWEYVARRGKQGAISDEVEVALSLRHQTASARLRELVLLGELVVLPKEHNRKTRSGRAAQVCVVPEYGPKPRRGFLYD